MIVSLGFIHNQIAKKYIKNVTKVEMDLVLFGMFSESVNAEISEVWRRTIEQKSVYINGQTSYFGDFNSALSEKYQELSFNGVYKRLDSLSNDINLKMKKLKKPLFIYGPIKNALMSMYINVNEMYNLAKSPSGSLNSFTETINELDSDIFRSINELKILVP